MNNRFSPTQARRDPVAAAKRIFGLITEEMKLVEKEYEKQTSSQIQVIDYLGDYLRESGGKRVRPALLILSSNAVDSKRCGESTIRLATVMEMLHTATLVHDDIIDNSYTRRNRASVNAKFGNQTAVLMGDWLYMTAFETSLRERSLDILDILTALTRLMTEGELIQLTVLGRSDISVEDYFDILRRKTAYLFSACCEIGALLSGANEEQRIGLRDYGMNLGIAFQLADDVLDFIADDNQLGKRSGADLLEGKLTLPLILLRDAQPGIVGQLDAIMARGEYQGEERRAIRKALELGQTIEKTRTLAHEHAAAARKNLEILPDSEYRRALEEVTVYMIDREK
jgi:octaprenyl-diphosphate synthase